MNYPIKFKLMSLNFLSFKCPLPSWMLIICFFVDQDVGDGRAGRGPVHEGDGGGPQTKGEGERGKFTEKTRKVHRNSL